MEPTQREDEKAHLPGPSLWPVGFAVGVACILVGLVVSWPAVVAGAALTLVFGFLWIRDATRGVAHAPVGPPAEAAAAPAAPAYPAHEGEAAMPEPEPGEKFPRSKFLEASTLGLGALIGGAVTLPPVGFAILPAFLEQDRDEVDIGPLEEFEEGRWRIATFLEDADVGEVSRRTAYVRYNGLREGEPSFTIVSNRCAHLGCPVQPSGPVEDEAKKTFRSEQKTEVSLIPTEPAGFACPCHGGAYDTEGNVTAGPPVRALDRYAFSIRNGRLYLRRPYSVGKVEGTGKDARIHRYDLAAPGQHVDGWSKILYPIQPPRG